MDQARVCIESLAGLHAWSTDDRNAAVLGTFPSIPRRLPAICLCLRSDRGGTSILRSHRPRFRPPLPGFVEQFTARAAEALQALTERSMLLHGDIRADNLFFDGGRLKVVDFQFASCGVGAADIAYLVSQGHQTTARRGHDEALVPEYLERLTDHGVGDYSFDEAWRHYRFAVAYLMVPPVITLNGWDALPERWQALCVTLTDRAVATIDEIDALEVFS